MHRISSNIHYLNYLTIYRDRFLIGYQLKMSVYIRERDSIDVIKFVGRQHVFLTDISHQISFCYSFQVVVHFQTMIVSFSMNCSVKSLSIEILQMMFCAGIVFIKTLFMLYSTFHYINQSDVFFQKNFLTHISWLTYYLFFLFVVIHFSSTLTKEVRSLTLLNKFTLILAPYIFHLNQGKRIAYISHDITNSCDDPKVGLLVCIL